MPRQGAASPAWRSALRWRRTAIISWTSAIVLPVAVWLYFSLPKFVASAEVLLPLSSARIADPNSGAALGAETFIDGQVKLLASDRVLQKVIERMGLWHDPEIYDRSAAALGSLVAGSRVVSDGRDGERNARIAAFRERLEVRSLNPAPAVRISYASADPKKAEAVATAAAEAYIETYAAELQQETRKAASKLAQRLTRLQEHATSAAQAAVERPGSQNDPNATRRQIEAALAASLYGNTLAQYADTLDGINKPASAEPRIVRAAIASRDGTPSITILALALGVGGLLGLGLATLREAASRPLRSASDLGAQLGVASMGSVSLVSGRKLIPKRSGAPPLLLHDDRDQLRALLLRLRRGAAGREPLVLGIASALDGEGKSTIAFNLAVLAAEDGERVLLADMNLHNCTLTNAVAADGDSHLLEAVNGTCELEEAITETEYGFDVLGQRAVDDVVRPVSVLASQQMEALVERARRHYDIVICDLPPVLDHGDTTAMADTLDRLVFIAEWGRTPAPLLDRALRSSPLIESRLVGAVLNKTPAQS